MTLFVTFQLWRDSGKDGVEDLNTEILLGEEDDDVSDDEREEEEDGKVKCFFPFFLRCVFVCSPVNLSHRRVFLHRWRSRWKI